MQPLSHRTLRIPLLAISCLALVLGFRGQGAAIKNIEYSAAGGTNACLDVFPPEAKGPCPVALIIHGGGWGSGDKADAFCRLLLTWLSTNYACISLNYRLAPAHRWPACFEDVQTAIHWAQLHAAEYRGDPRRVLLLGYSAGGQLACLAAALAPEDSRVQAVVGFAPPTDLVADCARRGGVSPALQNLLGVTPAQTNEARKVLWAMSPLNHLTRGLPPFLLLHGTDDKSVPFNQSTTFRAKLSELDVPCELISIPGAPHDITKWGQFRPEYPEMLLTWLSKVFPPPNGSERQQRP
jgi:acetyl esterase/lipase